MRPLQTTSRRIAMLMSMALTLLLVTCACVPAPEHASAGSTPTPTPTLNPLARIHNATPDNIPLIVRVTFTTPTTYEQAVAILEAGPHPAEPYPWTCDEPRSPTPPPLAERRAAFAATHALLISYAVWDQLTQIASASQVVSVDGTAVYPCP